MSSSLFFLSRLGLCQAYIDPTIQFVLNNVNIYLEIFKLFKVGLKSSSLFLLSQLSTNSDSMETGWAITG